MQYATALFILRTGRFRVSKKYFAYGKITFLSLP